MSATSTNLMNNTQRATTYLEQHKAIFTDYGTSWLDFYGGFPSLTVLLPDDSWNSVYFQAKRQRVILPNSANTIVEDSWDVLWRGVVIGQVYYNTYKGMGFWSYRTTQGEEYVADSDVWAVYHLVLHGLKWVAYNPVS